MRRCCLRPGIACLFLIVFQSLLPPGAGLAADGLEVLEGFEETVVVPEAGRPAAESSPLRLGGWFKVGGTYNFAHEAPEEGETDWRGLSRLRAELLGEAELRLPAEWRLFASGKGFYDFAYALNGRGDYTDEVLDDYEKELELREAWIGGRLAPGVDLKAGRQIVPWGRSDNVRVTDVLNPLDLREPGLTDIEDLRLPVAMTRLDAFSGPWRLTGVAVHEIRFDKRPPFGHDFFPAEGPLSPEEEPAKRLENAEFGAALTGTFPGWDVSLYWADFYDDLPHVEETAGGPALRHSRLTMVGAAGSVALGNVLLFGEAARFDGLEFFNDSGKFARTEVLLGTEYAGFRDTTVSFEAVWRRLHGFRRPLALPPDEAGDDAFETVVRLTRTFWNERLKLTLLAFTFGPLGQDGALQRLQGTYELRDGMSLTAGVVLFGSGDLPAFRGVGDNDRAFMEFRYDF